MNRDRVLRLAIVVFLGIGVIGAGANTFFATEAVVPLLVQVVALLIGFALVGFVIVRGELTETQRRSGVGTAAGGASIAVSGAVMTSAAEFGAIVAFLGAVTSFPGS
jgi:CHASE1-domain containing sensor protein